MKLTRLIASALIGGAVMTAGAVQADGVSDTEIVLGTHSALSGPVALWGAPAVEAMRMRFDEINEAGGVHGRQIKLIVEDTQYQVPRAVQAANKLVNRDGIFAMVGAVGTPMNNAVIPSLIEANVPNLFPFSSSRQMTQPFHRLKFQHLSNNYDQIRAAVKYFVEEKGVKTVCVMYQDTDYGREINEATVDQLKVQGLELAEASAHDPSATDFAAAVAKLKNANCEAIMMGTIIRDTILPVSTAKKSGWEPIWVGPVGIMDTLVADAKGGVTEGLYSMTSYEFAYPDDPRPEVQKFVTDYTERVGSAPNQAAQLGYVSADLTYRALEAAGPDLTVDSFIAAMEGISGYQDIFGGPTLTFGPDKRQGSNDSFLVQVENGRWVRRSDIRTY